MITLFFHIKISSMFNITELKISKVSHNFLYPEKENSGRIGRPRNFCDRGKIDLIALH